jgi:hypothetical protein
MSSSLTHNPQQPWPRQATQQQRPQQQAGAAGASWQQLTQGEVGAEAASARQQQQQARQQRNKPLQRAVIWLKEMEGVGSSRSRSVHVELLVARPGGKLSQQTATMAGALTQVSRGNEGGLLRTGNNGT